MVGNGSPPRSKGVATLKLGAAWGEICTGGGRGRNVDSNQPQTPCPSTLPGLLAQGRAPHDRPSERLPFGFALRSVHLPQPIPRQAHRPLVQQRRQRLVHARCRRLDHRQSWACSTRFARSALRSAYLRTASRWSSFWTGNELNRPWYSGPVPTVRCAACRRCVWVTVNQRMNSDSRRRSAAIGPARCREFQSVPHAGTRIGKRTEEEPEHGARLLRTFCAIIRPRLRVG